jgi:hypothetical protein
VRTTQKLDLELSSRLKSGNAAQTHFLVTITTHQRKVTGLRLHVLALGLTLLVSALLLSSSGQVAAGGSKVVGTVYAKNYMGDYRATGWANVTATDGNMVLRAWTTSDGRYQLFLGTGSWELIVSLSGYKTVSKVIAVPDGGTVTYDFYLEESGIPIPEFHEYAAPIITSISLILTILLLRRRTSTPRLS